MGVVVVVVFRCMYNPWAYNTVASNTTQAMYNPWAQHKSADLPERLGDPYIVIFRGADDNAAIAIQGSDASPAGIIPIWKGLVANPSTKITGAPFVWKQNGVEYRSSCAAFEKNMVFARQAFWLWNQSHGSDKAQNLQNLREAHALVCHLVRSGGLADDKSLPEDTRLVPPALRTQVLTDLCVAIEAVIVSILADGTSLDTYADGMSQASLRNLAVIKESSLIKKAWYNTQKAMALGSLGCALVRQAVETTPSKKMCTKAYVLLKQALAIKGCPGADTYRTAQQVCLADLANVFFVTPVMIKALQKHRPVPAPQKYDTPVLPEWFTAPPDIMHLGGDAIQIHSNDA